MAIKTASDDGRTEGVVDCFHEELDCIYQKSNDL